MICVRPDPHQRTAEISSRPPAKRRRLISATGMEVVQRIRVVGELWRGSRRVHSRRRQARGPRGRPLVVRGGASRKPRGGDGRSDIRDGTAVLGVPCCWPAPSAPAAQRRALRRRRGSHPLSPGGCTTGLLEIRDAGRGVPPVAVTALVRAFFPGSGGTHGRKGGSVWGWRS
jgi:hypothetical protein